MRVIIFGTGSSAKKLLSSINKNKVKIVAFLDNDKNKHNSLFFGVKVFSPSEIHHLQFDKVIIASEFIVEIFEQLIELGIPVKKIIPYYYDKLIRYYTNSYMEELESILQKAINKNKIKRIGLLKVNNSGSNTLALYKLMPEYIKEKYSVSLIKRDELLQDPNFDLICSTTNNSIYKPGIINVQLWHGFPLKKIGTRTELFKKLYRKEISEYTHKVISYSEIYSSLFNASFPNDEEKYEICGMPRNDLLFNNNINLFSKFFCNIKNKKIIAYLPTYRTWQYDMKPNGNRNWNNLFGFEDFNLERFVSFCRENNYFFFCKLHHMEYNKLDLNIYDQYSDVIGFLNEDELEKSNIDLYELLSSIDMLITDYSSVYFDLLLRDIPIIFAPVDLESYEKNRGFNLEPYDFWAPGDKVYSQNELQKAIKENLLYDNYKIQRNNIKKIVHRFTDNNSADRVWKTIDKLLKE